MGEHGRRGRRRASGEMRHLFWGALPLAALLLATLPLAACGPGGQSVGQPQAPPPTRTEQPLLPVSALTYVAIGASDAFGVGTDDPARQSWPTVLASQLGSSVHLINLGIPGATTDEALRDEVPVALDARPGVVTIFLGINDVIDGIPLATSLQKMRSLLATLRATTNARIYLGNLPDLTLLPYFAHDDLAKLRGQILDFNGGLEALAAEEGVRLVNLYATWADQTTHPAYISADGLHPSVVGAARLAQLFADAIRPDLRG
ncbi:MAG: hypothetical protein IVW57_00985 [Ktedonobacterales bacterium]|nr:hypothetical protein [Ktedonobacterales bacterium]